MGKESCRGATAGKRSSTRPILNTTASGRIYCCSRKKEVVLVLALGQAGQLPPRAHDSPAWRSSAGRTYSSAELPQLVILTFCRKRVFSYRDSVGRRLCHPTR